jgi:Cys-tRNA synthase (O-phospho-L-seryl-tRNA:Cys-tRNA synthase)
VYCLLKGTPFLSNNKFSLLQANCASQLQPLDLRIIRAFRKQLMQKTAALIDQRLVQDARQMKLAVLSAMTTLNCRSLLIDNTHYNQEMLCEVQVSQMQICYRGNIIYVHKSRSSINKTATVAGKQQLRHHTT